jgi:hypothetical protein
VPAVLGATGVVATERVTLYGGELRSRQYVPPAEAATFTDAGVIFDYAVEFGIHIAAFDIHSAQPLRVRYRAPGFNLSFPRDSGGVHYQPIFDTSKGYELDSETARRFALPAGLDNVLRVLGARIARTNPTTLELDLGLKVDLGVVTVDRFKIRAAVRPTRRLATTAGPVFGGESL